MKKINKKRFILLLLLCISLFSFAAECTWTGNISNNWMNAGNWSCGTIPTATDNVTIANASPTLTTDTQIGAMTLSGNSTILGIGDLTIAGDFNISTGSTIQIETKVISTGPIAWENATVSFPIQPIEIQNGGSLDNTTLWFMAGASLTVAEGSTLTVNGTCPIFGFTNIPSFVVNGTLNVQNSGFMDFEAIYLFENATINIIDGSIVNYLQQGSLNSVIENSIVNISPGSSLHIARVIDINDSIITGGGTLFQSFGVGKITGNTSLTNIDLDIQNGNFNCTNAILQQVNNINLDDGSINANNSTGLTCSGNLNWEGGDLEGMVTINGFATITDITPGVTTRFTNQLFLLGGGLCTINDRIIGTLTIGTATVFNIVTTQETIINNLVVEGILRMEGSADLVINSILTLTENGVVTGEGRIVQGIPLINNGTIAPGLPIGSLLFNSGLGVIFQSTSSLALDADVTVDEFIAEGNLTLNGELIVQETGILANGSYTIVSSTGTISGVFSSVNLPDSYSIEYFNNSVQITKNAIDLTVSTTSTNSTCNGGNDGQIIAQATGIPPFEYSIDGEEFQSSPIFGDLAVGTYIITALDDQGTVATSEEIIITEPTMIMSNVLLEGDMITIDASGGTGTLLYSLDGVNYQTSNIFTGLENGIYTVYIQDENLCIISFSIEISVNNLLVTVSYNDITCTDENDGQIIVTASGGQEPYEYSIDGQNFQSSPVFDNLEANGYEVTVIDSDGFLFSSELIQLNNPEPILFQVESGASSDIVEVMASGGTGILLYSLDNINYQSNPVFSGLDMGSTYTMYVQDENGCVVSEEFMTLTSTSAPTLSSIVFYPNPVLDKASISYDENNLPTRLIVYSVQGVELQTKEADFNYLDLEKLESGSYFLKIFFEESTTYLPFIKL